VRVAQYLVAPFAVFGVAEAGFTVLAADTATLRENGVLARQRIAPVPARTVLAARITTSMIVSAATVLLLVAVGVAGYDVTIGWRKLPAMLVTLLLGAACCASLGLALAALVRTARAAQALAQGILIPLAFISDVFIVDADLPRWLAVTGSALPLKHFARAMAETFHPGDGYGFSPGHLTVLAVWTVAGALVALRRFGWQPRGSSRAQPPAEPPARAPARLSPPVQRPGRRPVALLPGQIRYALLGLRPWQSMAFFALGATQLGVALGSRARPGTRTNPMLLAAVAAAPALQFAGLYVPVLNQLLGTEPVPLLDLLAICALSSLGYAAIRLDRVVHPGKPTPQRTRP
jgi:ABC-2 type transport system permease protein